MGKVMTAAKKRPIGQEKPKRRSPITRAEGERRLIEAARQLIQTKPYSEVGVRDIAELADVNHGFVHNWFGSKNGLLLAVVRQQFLEIAETVQKAAPGTPAINFLDPTVTAATTNRCRTSGRLRKTSRHCGTAITAIATNRLRNDRARLISECCYRFCVV